MVYLPYIGEINQLTITIFYDHFHGHPEKLHSLKGLSARTYQPLPKKKGMKASFEPMPVFTCELFVSGRVFGKPRVFGF